MESPLANVVLPEPLEYWPFPDGPFRHSLGLKPLDPAGWIEIDREYPRELSLKRRLFDERREDIFAAVDEAAPACREMLGFLAAHLADRFADWFELDGQTLENRLTGESWDLEDTGIHPLELAARLVQEDLCVMERRGDEHVLTAGSVSFPSRWRVADKLGQSTKTIHAPVPFFATQIGDPTDRFMRTQTVEKPIWRINWSVHDTPELCQPRSPEGETGPPITSENAGDRLWTRAERQTLRRLPTTGAIVFTIRTYIRPLSDLATRPDPARRLATALRNFPAETVEYKSLGRYRDAAIAWLERALR